MKLRRRIYFWFEAMLDDFAAMLDNHTASYLRRSGRPVSASILERREARRLRAEDRRSA